MGKRARREYLKMIYGRYHAAEVTEKGKILDEFCKVCGYNRKYAIAKLNSKLPDEEKDHKKVRRRGKTYGAKLIGILAAIWEATGYLCSIRLKAALTLWMPWIRERFETDEHVENQLLSISARQMDRRLAGQKRQVKRRLYGRTKPGSLLKHMIPIRTEHWDVQVPGFTEVDLVSHSGNSADGCFAYSLNQTDILTTWVETRAILGKSERSVVRALDEMRHSLPFQLAGIDSDNGSEFINAHLQRYCLENGIDFTRGRPYKKDDNAHVEQKNWTHVRKLLGWLRYDTSVAVDAINDLYVNQLGCLMNLFTPSMKLLKKIRVGSKTKRVYDQAKTPLDRLVDCGKGNPEKVAQLLALRKMINPFELSKVVQTKVMEITRLASGVRPSSPRHKRGREFHIQSVKQTYAFAKRRKPRTALN
jgi:hypothetical protein